MKKCLLFWVFVCLFSFSWAKEAYNIKVKINGLVSTPVKLAYYFGDKQYIKQEGITDSKGVVVFNGDTALPTGSYIIFFNTGTYFEFLVEEQFFSIETEFVADSTQTTEKFIETLRAEKSPQNNALFEYSRFLKSKRDESDAINKLKEVYEKNPAKKAEAEKLIEQLNKMDEEVAAEQDKIIAAFKGKLLSKMLLASRRPIVPENITDKTEKYLYYRAHFWNDFDFGFAGLLYSNTYHQRLKEYMDNLTVQHYDSLFIAADYVIQLSKNNREFYKYNVTWFLNYYAASKTICFDAVYVALAKKYYESGLADWVEADNLKKIVDNANELSRCLCGQKAADIKTKTETYATPSLYKVNAKYSIVLFWDVDCGNCKREIKELKEIYALYKDSGVMVYSINLATDKEKWQSYSATEGITWINLQIDAINSDVRTDYNIKFTPQLFLLDEHKTLLYKRLDTHTLENILQSLLSKK